MKTIFMSCLFFCWSTVVLADPHLDLLSGHQWKGECRKVVNEGGKELKNQPYLRLQSTYTTEGTRLRWWVKSFKDSKCTQIHESRKYSFDCLFELKDEFAKCKQISTDVSTDEKSWKSEKFLDDDAMISEVKIDRLSKDKVKLFMPGESEENPPEELAR